MQNARNALYGLLGAYTVSMGFQTIFDWPLTGTKVQPPEILFLVLAVYIWCCHRVSWLHWLREHNRHPLIRAIGWYVLAFGVAALASGRWSCWLEWVGCLYLAALALVVAWFGAVSQLVRWYTWMGVAAALTGLVGWLLVLGGTGGGGLPVNDMYYPGIGMVRRALGATPTPNMLFSLLAFGLFFRWFAVHRHGAGDRWAWATTGLMAAGALATFSKQWLLWAGILVWWAGRRAGQRVWQIAAGLLLFCFLLFSHITLLKKDFPPDLRARLAYEYQLLVPEPVGALGDYYIYWNSYALWKKTAVWAGLQTFPLGVGPGAHCAFVETLRAEGEYPAGYPCNDPHGTYTGAFGELGLFGLLTLLYLMWQIACSVRRTLSGGGEQAAALSALFIYVAFEAWVVDVLNFRHLWWSMGVLMALDLPVVPKKAVSHPGMPG